MSQNDQQMIRNVAIKLMGVLAADAQTKTHEDLIEEAVKVGANALIDLNRIADALETLAGVAVVMANTPKSSIIKNPGR
jgi:uncharacterized protein YbjQ (UPF0145 family)